MPSTINSFLVNFSNCLWLDPVVWHFLSGLQKAVDLHPLLEVPGQQAQSRTLVRSVHGLACIA